MGKLIDGTWHTNTEYANREGKFVREQTTFRNRLRTGDADEPPVPGRYHLYVSYACPWAHRVLITRALKGLEDAVGVTVVDPFMGEQGWSFSDGMGATPDPQLGAQHLHEVYTAADPAFTGRVTVPVLWDTRARTIVNNESRDLVQLFDRELDDLASQDIRVWPEDLEPAVGAMIDANYQPINNGVYRAGFATRQEAYQEAVMELFERLDACEQQLDGQPFLCGDRATAADICLFTTLLRLELVYQFHFKCNLRPLRSYPNLWDHTRALYQHPRIRPTCNVDHIKLHYFRSHPNVNPTRIVPAGPELAPLDTPVTPARARAFSG